MSKKSAPIYKITQYCAEAIPPYFKITSFDVEACTASEFLEHHRHEYYEIVWLKKGQGIHHIDTESYPYTGSVLFLLSPGQVHRLEQKEKAEGYVIKFLPGIFQQQKEATDFLIDRGLFDNIIAHPVIKLTATQYPVFDDLFTKLSIEYNTEEPGRDEILSSYIKILLTHIQRLKQQQQNQANHIPEPGYELFRKYKIAVEKNFRSVHAVQQYADMLITQARTLNAVSRKHAGRSAGQLITDRILLEAKRHLHYGSLSMKEISFDLGFDDPAYFTRLFKKHVGTAPYQYKLYETQASPKKETA